MGVGIDEALFRIEQRHGDAQAVERVQHGRGHILGGIRHGKLRDFGHFIPTFCREVWPNTLAELLRDSETGRNHAIIVKKR